MAVALGFLLRATRFSSSVTLLFAGEWSSRETCLTA
jgi:hypothetical protein